MLLVGFLSSLALLLPTSWSTAAQERATVGERTPADIEVPGLVAPRRRAAISSPIAGTIETVDVSVGARVRAGDRLIAFDTVDAEFDLLAARAVLAATIARANASKASAEKARVGVSLAEGDLERARRSREQVADSVTDAELERREMLVVQARIEAEIAQATHETAERETNGAEVAVRRAEKQLDRHRLVAPFDGVMTRVAAVVGETREAGTVLFEVIDDSERRIDLLAPESLFAVDSDRLSGRVIIGNDVLEGVIVERAPEIDPVHGSFRLRLALPADDRLAIGSRVQVRLTVRASDGPEAASDRSSDSPIGDR
jgi:multidrug efflux pump subunit AcrA (membrane-fusion protein)